jgi:hypothetical protein
MYKNRMFFFLVTQRVTSFTGTLTVVWLIAWQYSAYNQPELHPRIGPHELLYIQQLRSALGKDKAQTVSALWSCSPQLTSDSLCAFSR